MKSNYIVVSVSEDGDVYMSTLTEDTLKERLNEDYWGREVQFLTPGTRSRNLMENGCGIYIIKGEIVTPRAKEVVTQWEV